MLAADSQVEASTTILRTTTTATTHLILARPRCALLLATVPLPPIPLLPLPSSYAPTPYLRTTSNLSLHPTKLLPPLSIDYVYQRNETSRAIAIALHASALPFPAVIVALSTSNILASLVDLSFAVLSRCQRAHNQSRTTHWPPPTSIQPTPSKLHCFVDALPSIHPPKINHPKSHHSLSISSIAVKRGVPS